MLTVVSNAKKFRIYLAGGYTLTADAGYKVRDKETGFLRNPESHQELMNFLKEQPFFIAKNTTIDTAHICMVEEII